MNEASQTQYEATQIWIIENRQFPAFRILPQRFREIYSLPNSTAYFCPERGEIWARRIVLKPDGSLRLPWQFRIAPHPSEPPPWESYFGNVPSGTLIPFWAETDELLNYPPFILEREFLLQYEHEERLSELRRKTTPQG
jgi:hypothetical protein